MSLLDCCCQSLCDHIDGKRRRDETTRLLVDHHGLLSQSQYQLLGVTVHTRNKLSILSNEIEISQSFNFVVDMISIVNTYIFSWGDEEVGYWTRLVMMNQDCLLSIMDTKVYDCETIKCISYFGENQENTESYPILFELDEEYTEWKMYEKETSTVFHGNTLHLSTLFNQCNDTFRQLYVVMIPFPERHVKNLFETGAVWSDIDYTVFQSFHPVKQMEMFLSSLDVTRLWNDYQLDRLGIKRCDPINVVIMDNQNDNNKSLHDLGETYKVVQFNANYCRYNDCEETIFVIFSSYSNSLSSTIVLHYKQEHKESWDDPDMYLFEIIVNSKSIQYQQNLFLYEYQKSQSKWITKRLYLDTDMLFRLPKSKSVDTVEVLYISLK